MRKEISRETYEELRGTPGLVLEMEAKYYMSVETQKVKVVNLTPERKRRSPTDMITVVDESVAMPTVQCAEALFGALKVIGDQPIPSKTLGKSIANYMGTTDDMGSYYVGQLIKLGALGVVSD